MAIRTSDGPEAVNFEGTYQLSVPSIPFTLRSNTLTITFCNSYSFKIVRASAGNIISVNDPITLSINAGCERSNDAAYISLIKSVNTYQVVGKTLYLLSQKKIVASADRYRSFWPEYDRLEGKFELNLPKVTLTATATNFSFRGCNTNNFTYAATSDTRIAITTLQNVGFALCPVNLDQIYSSALLKSKNFVSSALEFTFYGADGEESAYGTPQ